jgi:hypothetical protein
MTDRDSASSGERLSAFVETELAKEEARRESIEKRGLSVVTVAAGILGLVSALHGVSGTGRGDQPSHVGHVLLTASAVLVVAGTIAGAMTNAPRRYRLIDPEELLASAPTLWQQSPDATDRALFASNLTFLRDAQRTNDARARFLFAALTLSGLGIVGIALGLLT